MKNEITYTVRFFETKADFKKKKVEMTESGFKKKSIVLKHANMYVEGGEYEVAEIKSSDKKYVKVIEN